MLVEQRTYILQPGAAAEFLSFYMDGIVDLQTSILGRMIGYFTTDIGPLNQVVHLWGYESLDERSRRRQIMAENKSWQEFLSKVLPLIVTMDSKILVPTSFSPIQ